MSILNLINNRHSYRGEYEATPIPRKSYLKNVPSLMGLTPLSNEGA